MKKYRFCTHGVGIMVMVIFGLLGLSMVQMEKFGTDPLYPVLLIFGEICVVVYSIYIWFCFSLTVDEKGVRLQKGQNIIRIDWDQVASISIVDQMSTRRTMLRVTPKAFIREKKIPFWRTQVTETIETDVAMKYIDAIRQFYPGEILGMARLEEKLKAMGKDGKKN